MATHGIWDPSYVRKGRPPPQPKAETYSGRPLCLITATLGSRPPGCLCSWAYLQGAGPGAVFALKYLDAACPVYRSHTADPGGGECPGR
jgi:hypothetical protein